MAKKPESRRQKRIRETLEREVGGKWFKVHGGPFQESGLPDLIGCVHGMFFGFEVKEPDGEATELQLEQLDEYRRNGGIAELVETPEEAVAIVERAVRRAKARGLVLFDTRRERAVLRARRRKDVDTPSSPRTKRR